MNIFIPTLNRIGKQPTWDALSQHEDLKRRTTLVCPYDELGDHKRLGRNAMGCSEKGIPAVRQWCINDNSLNRKILFIDDDHTFFKRLTVSSTTLVAASPEDIFNMVQRIDCLLETYPMVGVSARQGNNNFDGTDAYATRMCNMYGLRSDILFKEGIRMDAVQGKEDFYTQLYLLTKGYNTTMITDMVWNQPSSNAKGGCSEYRTLETDIRDSVKLNELFPDFVKIVTKNSKWPGMPNRTDVTVYWKKAYEFGQRNKK